MSLDFPLCVDERDWRDGSRRRRLTTGCSSTLTTKLRQILLTELRSATKREVHDCSIEDCTTRRCSTAPSSAAVPARSEPCAPRCLPASSSLCLPITSANQWLLPWMPAPKGLLIAVVSHWPEFLDKARTMLAAAGVPAEALIFCDARKPRGSADLPSERRALRCVHCLRCEAAQRAADRRLSAARGVGARSHSNRRGCDSHETVLIAAPADSSLATLLTDSKRRERCRLNLELQRNEFPG